MSYSIHVENGVVNRGNWYRIKKCMQRANNGEAITVGFLGGSITQGCLSSAPETCYSYLVYLWWKTHFPKAQVSYLNAGIGGTTSQYGVSRVHQHFLPYKPDFALVEFAVNDDDTEFFEETYEGLVRNIYGADYEPALMLMHNVRYNDGGNAEEQHNKIVRAYQIPCVSMKSSIYPEIASGTIKNREITSDDLHPNDAGHELVARTIIYLLEQIYETMEEAEEPAVFDGEKMPRALTANAYETSIRYQNHNSECESVGFVADTRKQNDIKELFRNGWTADKEGASITFHMDCTGVAVQYRKSINKPTPIARVVVDDLEESAVILDGNFDEDWGDCLYIDTVTKHMERGIHKVKISITEAHEEDVVPFYLVSVIGSH